MIARIKGEILEILADSCVVDVRGIGYQIHTPHPHEFKVGEQVNFFTYHHIREDLQALYGFTTKAEKELYIKLLSVKGVGPKVAMTMLAATQNEILLHAIENEDVTYLRKIPGIGPKAAGQIILDLRGKLAAISNTQVLPTQLEVIDALTALGYTKKEIDFAMKNIDKNLEVESMVKQALKNLMG